MASRTHLLPIHTIQRVACAALGLLACATAQELRLKDGRVLVGEYRERSEQYEVTTREGVVLVPKAAVSQKLEVDDLRAKLREEAQRNQDSAFAHLNLAQRARDYGLERELWQHLSKALAHLEQDGGGEARASIERRLRDFLAQLEPELLPRELRQAPTEKRVQAILRLFRADTGDAREAALEELLVREANADQDLRREARSNPNRRQRIAALHALERRKVAGNERFVLRTAVLDRDSEVREAAIALGRASITEDDVLYMASGLAHPQPKVRERTAEALGGLGHPRAIELLVKAGPVAGAGLAGGDDGNSPRAHVAFLQQQAYIRDYDVEVAQAAFIADPQIGLLQSGTVLDAKVLGVQQVRTIVKVYRQALRQLTSTDPGPDPRDWATWLAKLPAPAKPAETGKR